MLDPLRSLSPFARPLGLRAALQGSPAFDPASLFASGEEGILLEPSPSTCFTDTGGTTAASLLDPVARINDSSGNGNHATQATEASRPLLLANWDGTGTLSATDQMDGDGTFDSGISGWAARSGASIAWDGVGKMSVTTTGAVNTVYYLVPTTPGKVYHLSFDIDITGSDYDLIAFQGNNFAPNEVVRNQNSLSFTAYSTSARIGFQSLTVGVPYTVDNVSVREVPDGAYLYKLRFDGVDDYLETVTNHPFTFTGSVSLFAGFSRSAGADTYDTLFSVGGTGVTTSNARRSMAFMVTDAGNDRLATDVWTPSGVRGSTTLTPSVTGVASFNIANWSTHRSSGSAIRLNGVDEVVVSYGSDDPISLNTSKMRVGVFDTILTTSFLAGDIFTLICRDAACTVDETTATESYVADKTGKTL